MQEREISHNLDGLEGPYDLATTPLMESGMSSGWILTLLVVLIIVNVVSALRT